MKQSVQRDVSQASKIAEHTRSRSAQQKTSAAGGHLAQLAAMINAGPKAEGLMMLAAEINQGLAAQLRTGPVNDDVKTSDAAPVQRTVLSKFFPLVEGGFKTVYYSTHDPEKEFETEEEAWDYDKTFASIYKPEDRVPTNFTYY